MRCKSLCLMSLWACILKSKGYGGVGYVVRSSVPIIKAIKLLSFFVGGSRGGGGREGGGVVISVSVYRSLTFIGPCIANAFADFNQQDATFHTLFISVIRSTCFRRPLRPSPGAQNCTYSVRHLSDRY
jgi:hypothetical protein